MSKNELIEKAVLHFGGKWIFPFKNLVTPAETNAFYAPHSRFESIRNVFELGPHWVFICTEEEFNAAADRMRGKPDWKDAPDWAQWLAQDSDGVWYFYASEIPPSTADSYFTVDEQHNARSAKGSCLGDWRNTLERRPEQSKPLEAGRFGIMPPVNKNEACSMTAPAKPWFEAGELPKAGTKCLCYFDDGRECWHECVVIGSIDSELANGYLAVSLIGKHDRKLVWVNDFKSIKTEKEKAIEAAIEAMQPNSLTGTMAIWFGKLYDAGLLRLPDQK